MDLTAKARDGREQKADGNKGSRRPRDGALIGTGEPRAAVECAAGGAGMVVGVLRHYAECRREMVVGWRG